MPTPQQTKAIRNLASLCWLAGIPPRDLRRIRERMPAWLRYDGWQGDLAKEVAIAHACRRPAPEVRNDRTNS